MDLRPFIRDVPDFPKPGIVFKDITPLLRSHEALDYISHALAEPFKDAGVTTVAAIESRGFIFGSGVARVLGAGFVPIRKPGKLPWKTRRSEYTLEYGSGVLEIAADNALVTQGIYIANRDRLKARLFNVIRELSDDRSRVVALEFSL